MNPPQTQQKVVLDEQKLGGCSGSHMDLPSLVNKGGGGSTCLTRVCPLERELVKRWRYSSDAHEQK